MKVMGVLLKLVTHPIFLSDSKITAFEIAHPLNRNLTISPLT